jgi:hypothetical protein
MGFSYRKSVKMGPFRMTASKSGVSYSVGVKGARVTRRANGRVQTTLSAPGTGLRYTTSGTGGKKLAGQKMATPARAVSTPSQASRPSPPTASARARPPRQVPAPKPARPPKPVRLRGNRFSAQPLSIAPWLLPFTVSTANGMVTVHQGGIRIQRRRAKPGLPAVTDLAWRELTGIDFLEPGHFFSFGHVHFVTAGGPRGLVTTGAGLRSSAHNPHAVQFIPPSGKTAYRQLRDLLTGCAPEKAPSSSSPR